MQSTLLFWNLSKIYLHCQHFGLLHLYQELLLVMGDWVLKMKWTYQNRRHKEFNVQLKQALNAADWPMGYYLDQLGLNPFQKVLLNPWFLENRKSRSRRLTEKWVMDQKDQRKSQNLISKMFNLFHNHMNFNNIASSINIIYLKQYNQTFKLYFVIKYHFSKVSLVP